MVLDNPASSKSISAIFPSAPIIISIFNKVF
jgi:hypothetical protein